VVANKQGQPTEYRNVHDAPIIEMPDTLLTFLADRYAACKAKASKEKSDPARMEPVLEGGRNTWLASKAGELRHRLLNEEEILPILSRFNEEYCSPPLDESEVATIAHSIGNKPLPKNSQVWFNGKPGGQRVQAPGTPTDAAPAIVIDTSATAARPEFPYWAMEGTTLYTGLIKPAVEQSSKYPEFIFVPAVQMMMNYLSGSVRVADFSKAPAANWFTITSKR
jgi:hypothetical protein